MPEPQTPSGETRAPRRFVSTPLFAYLAVSAVWAAVFVMLLVGYVLS